MVLNIMAVSGYLFVAFLSTVSLAASLSATASLQSQVKQSLTNTPGIIGIPCSDRKTWEGLKQNNPNEFEGILKKAREMHDSMPQFEDSKYLEYKANGQRNQAEVMMKKRVHTLTYLALAECIKFDGSFMQPLISAVKSVATQRSWSLPAHDPDLSYFHGKMYFVELHSAWIAATLSQVLYLFGDKINAPTQSLVKQALKTRVFDPVIASLSGNGPSQWWMNAKTNWNAVCWAGVVIAANSVLEDIETRAYITSAAWQLSTLYLDVFTSDGYNQEGVGYFKYVICDQEKSFRISFLFLYIAMAFDISFSCAREFIRRVKAHWIYSLDQKSQRMPFFQMNFLCQTFMLLPLETQSVAHFSISPFINMFQLPSVFP
jgi:hypothetical protein